MNDIYTFYKYVDTDMVEEIDYYRIKKGDNIIIYQKDGTLIKDSSKNFVFRVDKKIGSIIKLIDNPSLSKICENAIREAKEKIEWNHLFEI